MTCLKRVNLLFVAAIIAMVVTSCNGFQPGDQLSKSEVAYIKGLGLLEGNEKILLFETHSGKMINSYKTSGNFISDRRLAGYWIDNHNPEKSSVDFAYYEDIDTLIAHDLTHDFVLASYLCIKKRNGQAFNLFISGKSSAVHAFFHQATREWKRRRNRH